MHSLHKKHFPPDRFLVVAMMIGSLISSTSRIGANSLTPKGKIITSSFGSILSSSQSSTTTINKASVWGLQRSISGRRALSIRSGSFFRRYIGKESSNEMKGSVQRNSTLLMSSVAAMSVSGAVAMEELKNDDKNVTLCADNDDEQVHTSTDASSTLIFPEEALYNDTYNGVTINVSKLPTEEYLGNGAEKFASALKNSLKTWKSVGKRGIWINIPTEHSIVVPECAELGFEFQHAKNGLLVMTKWLPEHQASRLPHGPTHQVGVGIILVHPTTKKMLVVQEKSGPAAGEYTLRMSSKPGVTLSSCHSCIVQNLHHTLFYIIISCQN